MLHQLDEVVQPDGTWNVTFVDRLAAYRANGLGGGALVDAATWTRVVGDLPPPPRALLPWGHRQPTEADLVEYVPQRVAVDGTVRLARTTSMVHVLTHRRHLTPLLPSLVSVLLLRRRVAVGEDVAALTMSDQWRNEVVARVTGSNAPVDEDGWLPPDPGNPVRHPEEPLDARTPQAVTFEVDWSTAATPLGSTFMLLAVVSTSEDTVTAARLGGATLRELVLGSHHVAAKQVWLMP
jgi:hypothetical protein